MEIIENYYQTENVSRKHDFIYILSKKLWAKYKIGYITNVTITSMLKLWYFPNFSTIVMPPFL